MWYSALCCYGIANVNRDIAMLSIGLSIHYMVNAKLASVDGWLPWLLQQRADGAVQSRYSQMDFSSLLWTSLAAVGSRPGLSH